MRACCWITVKKRKKRVWGNLVQHPDYPNDPNVMFFVTNTKDIVYRAEKHEDGLELSISAVYPARKSLGTWWFDFEEKRAMGGFYYQIERIDT